MSLISPENIAKAGIIAIAGVVFAESGLMIGFFLPGDSLLFTAGFLSSIEPTSQYLHIHTLVVACFVAAVVGDSVGYAFGNKVGPTLLKRPDGKIFKKRYIAEAEKFYEEHGKKTIIIARFVPIVRTFAPIVAGIGSMHYRTFLAYNVIGGFLWTFGITYLGYFLGHSMPWTKDYIELAVIGVVFLSLLPGFYHVLKEQENRQKLKKLPAVTYQRIKKIIRRAEKE